VQDEDTGPRPEGNVTGTETTFGGRNHRSVVCHILSCGVAGRSRSEVPRDIFLKGLCDGKLTFCRNCTHSRFEDIEACASLVDLEKWGWLQTWFPTLQYRRKLSSRRAICERRCLITCCLTGRGDFPTAHGRSDRLRDGRQDQVSCSLLAPWQSTRPLRRRCRLRNPPLSHVYCGI